MNRNWTNRVLNVTYFNIHSCSPRSAMIIYSVKHSTDVTDQDRADRAAELFNGIDPNTNSMGIYHSCGQLHVRIMNPFPI